MQQVADWLEKLGLGQYAQRFAENDIDFALLTKLTDAGLQAHAIGRRSHSLMQKLNFDGGVGLSLAS